MFLDLFLNKLKVRENWSNVNVKIQLRPLPSPREAKVGAVDGGGRAAKLERGLVLYVARGALVSEEGIEREMIAEICPWESKPYLESARSLSELMVAQRFKGDLLLMDGSYYTIITRWLQRLFRIAMMRAKVSEIASLPYTLLALENIIKVIKMNAVFVAKSPNFKIFKEYLLLKELFEETGDEKFFILMKEPYINKKDLIDFIKDPKIGRKISALLNASLSDIDLLEGEGVSKGLEPGVPRALRRFLSPSKLKEVVEIARENYQVTFGDDTPKVDLSELCFLRSPVVWWVKIGRVVFTVEEASGSPLCTSAVRREVDAYPRSLPKMLSSSNGYSYWLTLAHVVSTVKASHLETYLQLVRSRLGLESEAIREDLIFSSRAR